MLLFTEDAPEAVEVDQGGRHAKRALEADIEALAQHFVEQVELVRANYQVENGPVEVEQVVHAQLLDRS